MTMGRAAAPALLKMAFRNIARNRRRSVLTGTSVALGVAAILFARAYIDGLQALILEYVIEARNGALQVQREGYGASQDLAPLDIDLPATESFLRTLQVPGVEAVAPRLRFSGLLSNGEASTVVWGLGIDPESDARVCPRGPGGTGEKAARSDSVAEMVDGRGFQHPDDDSVIVGVDLAAALEVQPGDTVTLLAQTQSGSMDAIDLTVVGLFQFSDPHENKHAIVLPLLAAQRLLHMQDRATAVAISVHDNDEIATVVAALQRALAGGDPPTETQTWADLSPYYRDVMSLQDSVLGVLVVVVFLLVLAGVVNTMLMAVFERTREIGTLMSIGFRRRRILLLFLVESTLLSGLASIAGAALGCGLVMLTNHQGLSFYIPAVGSIVNRPLFDASYLLFACVGACLGGIAGGVIPAVRASRMRPIEALRAF